MNRKVQKALSPEENAIIENIGSLIDQLKAGGAAGGVEEEVMMADGDPMMDPEDDPSKAMKANMGPTANPEDKAEDRVEDPTDITAGNLSEVGKSLTELVSVMKSMQTPRRVVRKAAAPQVGTNEVVLSALAEITTVMKSLADQQNQQNMAIGNILDGIGFTESVQKSLDAQKPAAPVANMDGGAILQELTTVLKSLQGQQVNAAPQGNGNWNVRKSNHEQLRDALPALLGGIR